MSEEGQPSDNGALVRLVKWFDSRLGLSYPLLRPVPRYSINPFYWLGALTIVAFTIQAVSGTILLFWYVPNPTDAYTSTLSVFNSITYGRFLETVHLYGAYSMILLAFMHMMRNYFVSSHKKPREMMWVVGMAMGFVTLGLGFTGYLLPWTVVSVDASSVGISLLNPLPPTLVSITDSILGVSGGAASELTHFYFIHILLLPAVLLLLLFGKMYMLEAHGVSPPERELTPRDKRPIPIFPNATVYILELSALFAAALFVIAAAFPYTLPAEYSVAVSANSVPQPDWYFLWMYQILKISVFEGAALPAALTLITVIFAALFVLPFIDRGKERRIAGRPWFITIGAIFVAELIVLTYWGKVTPGQVIPVEEAALVLGGVALLVAVVFLGIYRVMFSRLTGRLSPDASASTHTMTMKRAQLWTAAFFTGLLGVGSVAIAETVDSAAGLITSGMDLFGLLDLAASLSVLALVVFGTIYLIYRLDLATGAIKTKVSALEIGWNNES